MLDLMLFVSWRFWRASSDYREGDAEGRGGFEGRSRRGGEERADDASARELRDRNHRALEGSS